jgi:hypothetical protein
MPESTINLDSNFSSFKCGDYFWKKIQKVIWTILLGIIFNSKMANFGFKNH